jgi:hypothetical protein
MRKAEKSSSRDAYSVNVDPKKVDLYSSRNLTSIPVMTNYTNV